MMQLFMSTSRCVAGLCAGLAFLLLSHGAASATTCTAAQRCRADDGSIAWGDYMRHSVGYFDAVGARDPSTGAYASEIGGDDVVIGAPGQRNIHLVAFSRLIYALAYTADRIPENRDKARVAADFLLREMVVGDPLAADPESPPYFVATYNQATGAAAQEQLVVNVQAYGLNGLVALYDVTRDPELLRAIHGLYRGFVQRFHDPAGGGFFDAYDLRNQQPVREKSYNSTVYVATSFLLPLFIADPEHRSLYRGPLSEIAGVLGTRFADDTGWLVENFTADWQPAWRSWQRQEVVDPETGVPATVSIGIVGHNTQAAWLLLRLGQVADELDGASRPALEARAREILLSMLRKPAHDRRHGGFYNAFIRERDTLMWGEEKHWWQQAEGILALTLADRLGVLTRDEVLAVAGEDVAARALDFYFAHFVDYVGGGEFKAVAADGTPNRSEPKGELGKSAYHAVELARFMEEYQR
jgi:mannose/cellobiose epimerase-like protein (N-acyl-D-glucosamine 2-epimerase family)